MTCPGPRSLPGASWTQPLPGVTRLLFLPLPGQEEKCERFSNLSEASASERQSSCDQAFLYVNSEWPQMFSGSWAAALRVYRLGPYLLLCINYG